MIVLTVLGGPATEQRVRIPRIIVLCRLALEVTNFHAPLW